MPSFVRRRSEECQLGSDFCLQGLKEESLTFMYTGSPGGLGKWPDVEGPGSGLSGRVSVRDRPCRCHAEPDVNEEQGQVVSEDGLILEHAHS